MKRNRLHPLIKWLLVPLLLTVFATVTLAQDECTERYGNGSTTIRLATGSPGELGLLKVVADEFNKKNPTALCWKKAGSGASLKLLKEKKADLIMVHAPEAEKQAVKEGWAIKGNLIGSNEFYIFVISAEGQKIIGSYGADLYGEGIYNDAAYAEQYDH